MRPLPCGADLLACTSQLIKDRFLGTASADDKILLRMAVNAISIAERQLRNFESNDQFELEGLRKTLNNSSLCIDDGNRELAALIRLGKADPHEDSRAAVLNHLRFITKLRLSESNPKALGA